MFKFVYACCMCEFGKCMCACVCVCICVSLASVCVCECMCVFPYVCISVYDVFMSVCV
jgi:hypothetical protein